MIVQSALNTLCCKQIAQAGPVGNRDNGLARLVEAVRRDAIAAAHGPNPFLRKISARIGVSGPHCRPPTGKRKRLRPFGLPNYWALLDSNQ